MSCPSTAGTNGVSNGHSIEETHIPIDSQPAQEKPQQHNPYGPRLSDFLSNTSNFSIIESTLREGSVHSLFSYVTSSSRKNADLYLTPTQRNIENNSPTLSLVIFSSIFDHLRQEK
jgi:homocitrate synthase